MRRGECGIDEGDHHPNAQPSVSARLSVELASLGCGYERLRGGRNEEGVRRGYFAYGKRRRGRQLGRVLASEYDEIVNQRLYACNRRLHSRFDKLVLEAEAVLKLNQLKRVHALIPIDGGGGETKQVNWLLARDYLLITQASRREANRAV